MDGKMRKEQDNDSSKRKVKHTSDSEAGSEIEKVGELFNLGEGPFLKFWRESGGGGGWKSQRKWKFWTPAQITPLGFEGKVNGARVGSHPTFAANLLPSLVKGCRRMLESPMVGPEHQEKQFFPLELQQQVNYT
ncbi:hypothetical protein CEXT_36181 [Caerostris extrusa]|uniref:Uncharacterized protein n=1 Tax=Caerostris extrusa TaxID=172846 RepID=A0AAV4MF89_CAEEX|nr:hypothetical protein CEXT_36181 [Caerostris extrusa]